MHDLIVYYCTACNNNIADTRGLPVWDCALCGAGPEMLMDERRPESIDIPPQKE